jgi:predicted membrane protein
VGGTHLIVPDDIAVEVSGFSVFGGRRVDSSADSGPSEAPLVRLAALRLLG